MTQVFLRLSRSIFCDLVALVACPCGACTGTSSLSPERKWEATSKDTTAVETKILVVVSCMRETTKKEQEEIQNTQREAEDILA